MSDKIPFRISPMLATLVAKPFHLPGWIYEEKYDGVRILAYKEGGRISLVTRNAIVRTERYPEVAAAVGKLKPRTLLLDGEVVVFDKHNVSHFQLLQQGKGPVKYAGFDCLYLNGKDLRSSPLRERRETLTELLRGAGTGTIVLSEELAANGLRAFDVAKKRKLEGLVAKNLESRYVEKRSREWLKVKANRESEFVIGGYTKPSGSRQYLGALLLGVYEGNKLRYAGKVGTGFDTETLRKLSEELKKLRQDKSPFVDDVREKSATFVRPKLVAQIAYTEWTKDGRLRHPAFLGLRDDKAQQEVRKEEAQVKPSKKNSAVQISHPEKVFWPEEGYTKGDLANFYRQVFPWLQPYVRGRILTMERCPDGMRGECFYQKEMPKGMPPGTPTKRLPNKSGSRAFTNYIVGGSLETQMALVNLGCIPIHVTGSCAETFPKPDWVCLDIDPMTGSFQDAARASLLVKKTLDELRLASFPKTSGSRGVHIFIPIKTGPSADEALAFAEKLVALVAKSHPKELTVEHRIADRGDRVYLDPFRNGSVQTVVAPYSIRRKPHAPVSTPLDWAEVARIKDPAEFNIKTFPKRLKKKDPWAGFFSRKQSLQPALKQLAHL